MDKFNEFVLKIFPSSVVALGVYTV